MSFLWSHLYHCFELLVTSALDFKARVDSLTCVFHCLSCNRFLRFTSGATPADFLAVSMAAKPLNMSIIISLLDFCEFKPKYYCVVMKERGSKTIRRHVITLGSNGTFTN